LVAHAVVALPLIVWVVAQLRPPQRESGALAVNLST
jgi:hypothetical protein